MTGSAIILDGHLKSALCVARSLGRQNIFVACGSDRATALSLQSRFVARSFVYPSPKEQKDAFTASLLALAKELYTRDRVKPVVFTLSDATTAVLMEKYESFSNYLTFSSPTQSSFAIASDKQATYELAARLHIPTIRTYTPDEFDLVSFPLVVKYRHSIVWNEHIPVAGSAEFVFTPKELRTTFDAITKKAGEVPLVQQFVKGAEYGVEMVCDHGTILAQFVHVRVRSLSPRGGAAVVKQTAEDSPTTELMRKYARTLIEALQWHGPVMVEFKLNSETGQVVLMEINGRFWGSLPLAVRAGVDFPFIAFELVKDTPPKPVEVNWRPMRTRHFLGDCKWLFAVWFRKDPLRKMLYPSRLKALWDFKIEPFRSKGDVFASDDLLPSVMEYIDILNIWK